MRRIVLEVLFGGEDHARHAAHGKDIRAIGDDLGGDIGICAVDQRDDHDDRGHAHDYAEQREDGAHLAGPQGLQREFKGLRKCHDPALLDDYDSGCCGEQFDLPKAATAVGARLVASRRSQCTQFLPGHLLDGTEADQAASECTSAKNSGFPPFSDTQGVGGRFQEAGASPGTRSDQKKIREGDLRLPIFPDVSAPPYNDPASHFQRSVAFKRMR